MLFLTPNQQCQSTEGNWGGKERGNKGEREERGKEEEGMKRPSWVKN